MLCMLTNSSRLCICWRGYDVAEDDSAMITAMKIPIAIRQQLTMLFKIFNLPLEGYPLPRPQ